MENIMKSIESKQSARARFVSLLRSVGLSEQAEKALSCSRFVGFSPEGKLKTVNTCGLRLCPICAGLRASRLGNSVANAIDVISKIDYVGGFALGTVSLRNCSLIELRKSISHMTEGWRRLTSRSAFKRACLGWYRGIECPLSAAAKKRYVHRQMELEENFVSNEIKCTEFKARISGNQVYINQHIHFVFVVDHNYFGSHDFMSTFELCRLWQESCGLRYTPCCDLRFIRREKKDDDKALRYAAKYCVKPGDVLEASDVCAATLVYHMNSALHRCRLFAAGGIMIDALSDVGGSINGELVGMSIGDLLEKKRDDVAKMQFFHYCAESSGFCAVPISAVCPALFPVDQGEIL